MNTLLLLPTDVLFFRDGRPMGGSLGGHGSAWPLPTVANAALHAALHRADLEKSSGARLHGHDHHRRNGERVTDARKFGSLVSAGPFPVTKDGSWLFPRPLDAGLDKNENDSAQPTLLPLGNGFTRELSSLPSPLKFALANTLGPTKKTPSPWWNAAAWETHLGTAKQGSAPAFYNNERFADTEFNYGIGTNPDTGTQDGERFYSAHYLRLKPDCRLGLLATAKDKDFRDAKGSDDLIVALFPDSGSCIPMIIGGQQRLCTVQREHSAMLPLPKGRVDGFEGKDSEGKETWLVKWVLLTPAIFAEIKADRSKDINAHPGGWLPNWIYLDWNADSNEARENPRNGDFLLKSGDTERRIENGRLEPREAWRARVRSALPIPAKLVAALIGKPIPVTGYALPHEAAEQAGGAKPTHLAIPAGSVYFFQADSKEAAQKLANALNWHGAITGNPATDYTTIKNRRSTLMGEKGFGLGVCGTWQFHKTSADV